MKIVPSLLLLALGSSVAFNTNLPSPKGIHCSALSVAANDDALNDNKSMGHINGVAAMAAASVIMIASAFTPETALALSLEQQPLPDVPSDASFSSIVLSARSGGRGGGRAGGGGYSRPTGGAASYRGSYNGYSGPSRTTIIQPRTTIIAPPTMMYGSPSYLAPSPFGGFGIGYGLGAVGAVNDALRDMNQESEIQRSRQQLEEARMRRLEMEARLRQLEQNNAQVGGAPAPINIDPAQSQRDASAVEAAASPVQ